MLRDHRFGQNQFRHRFSGKEGFIEYVRCQLGFQLLVYLQKCEQRLQVYRHCSVTWSRVNPVAGRDLREEEEGAKIFPNVHHESLLGSGISVCGRQQFVTC